MIQSKHAEFSLQRDRKIYQTILEMSTDGFLIVDDAGIIIEVNRAYCEYLGLKREAMVGRPVLEVIKNSKLVEILKTHKTEVNVLHRLIEGQTPHDDSVVVVNRAPVLDQGKAVAAVGQVKFSRQTQDLGDQLKRLDQELKYYKSELRRIEAGVFSFKTMLGQSPAFLAAKRLAEKAASKDFTVLILGDTGTGKEVFAKAIHYASERTDKPLVRVNCAAIPAELLESELFGYEPGAFTGAKRSGKPGKFELANGGTIFLDEIGDMPLTMQAKLLRVLQEKEVERIGGDKPIRLDIRVIAATNQDLEKKVKDKSFRGDLFYRLNVIQLRLPSLQDRVEDIELFVDYFLHELNERYKSNVGFSAEAMERLKRYEWPGNVRELRNVVERSFNAADSDQIVVSSLPLKLLVSVGEKRDAGIRNLDTIMEGVEREIVATVLKDARYNLREAARILGIHRSTLYKKIEQYKIVLLRDGMK